MSTPRGHANQALYLANILLDAWRSALAGQQAAASAIDQAFFPAVRLHLLHAYGWFLLEIVDAEPPPDGRPPTRCAEVPPQPAGIAFSGELREFEQLERDGWLGVLLAADGTAAIQARSPGNLAAPSAGPGVEDAGDWAARLERLMARMRDSLDEC